MEIYLDNSATTAVSDAAREKAEQALSSLWGNPSSLHTAGLRAEELVAEAREHILSALGIADRSSVGKSRLIFTGSGTEADNLAVFGTARAKAQNRGGRIITTDSEHPAILEPCKALEREGFDVVYISTKGGELDLDQLSAALNDRTFLVSIMAVNNETGAAYNIADAFETAHRFSKDIITHTDAVQAFSHIPLSPDRIGADMVTVSGHKIHGPKGIGALLVRPELLKAKKIVPIIYGGGQEGGMRSGTENVPGIAGFGAAAAGFSPEAVRVRYKRIAALREYLLSKLPEDVSVNKPSGKTAPHILSLKLPSIKSETMLHFLSARNIYVSSGSACASHGKKASHVLTAFGLSPKEADCTLRVSLDDSVTEEMLDIFVSALEEGCHSLVKIN